MCKKIAVLIGILTAFAILVMPMVSVVSAQNIIYFAPQHSVIQEPSNNITVQVRANLSADSPINVWQTNITFDPACVNITRVILPDPSTGWSHSQRIQIHHEGCIKTCAVRFACGDAGSDILLANLTIHGEAWDCTSPLNFSGIVNVARFIGCTETLQMYHAAWINGTVTMEKQHSEEPHAPGDGGPGGSRGAGGASPPSPSPTLTPTSTPAPSPTLAPPLTPSATPVQTPSSTIPPTTDDQKQTLMWVIGLMAVSIMAIIIYTAFKLRKK